MKQKRVNNIALFFCRYKQNEDLYQWMAKQQTQFPMDLDDESTRYIHQNTAESCTAGLGSSWSQDDSRLDVSEEDYTMATSIMQLADAQVTYLLHICGTMCLWHMCGTMCLWHICGTTCLWYICDTFVVPCVCDIFMVPHVCGIVVVPLCGMSVVPAI